jgi:large subunit ribosomal protein L15e
VSERYPNADVLGSYYVYEDGRYIWYEVILADRNHPSLKKDYELRRRLGAIR